MIVFGIDPGLSGAIALHDGESVAVNDMPVFSLVRGGKNKREVDAAGVARILRAYGKIDMAFIEQVGAMPGQGVSSVFAFGKCYGILLGALAACAIPITLVPPQRWKKALLVPAAKDGARARASQLMPSAAHQWTRVKDDGRAEAALIAAYGLQSMTARAA